MRTVFSAVLVAALIFPSVILSQDVVPPKDATPHTVTANAALLELLPFTDGRDFDDAARGFIATIPDAAIGGADGGMAWDLSEYSFIGDGPAPATVNPSLWRQARLNLRHGLFKVVDGVYQIRGFDLSNMTIVEGDSGLILIDSLSTPATARAGLELYRRHRGDKPVAAVVYTHSHVDHYGGIKGVTNQDDVDAGRVRIIAPDKFLEESISENVYAGTAMSRRALYHTGAILPKSARGQVDSGLGKIVPMGGPTLIAPTDLIVANGEKRVVAGVEMEFLLAPGTEAPAEMLIYFPGFRMLNAAEDCTHTVHNLYTLRGAQVRDARAWWKALNAALLLYGGRTDVVVAQHHWPVWGNENVAALLESQRDLYKFIHDRTLNLANRGHTPVEIGELVRLPDSLSGEWWNRDYYGTVNHGAKAVYQRYLGWYDGNPSNLYPLPPADSAVKYLEYIGGAEAAIAMAKKDFDAGNYRWVAEIMNKAVFAEPENATARNLLADALEQLGYQAESATWRNNFLQGASELRNGAPNFRMTGGANQDVVRAMTPEMLLDYMGIRLNVEKADGKTLDVVWNRPGEDLSFAVELRNSVLIYTEGKRLERPDAVISVAGGDLSAILMGGATLDEMIEKGALRIDGDVAGVKALFAMFDAFDPLFNIVTP